MLYRFHCVNCGQRIKVEEETIGQRLNCPACQFRQEIPAPAEIVPPPAPPLLEVPEPAPPVEQLPKPAPLSPLQKYEAEHKARQARQPVVAPAVEKPPTRLKKARTLRGSLYMFFILASIPLFLGILFEDKDDVTVRLEQTIKELPKQAKARATKVYDEYKRDDADIEEVLQVLPDKKIKGAWLPLYSKAYYYFTGIAAVAYMLMLGLLIPKGFAQFHVKVFIAFFTGTAGIALLFIIQEMATSGRGALAGGPLGIIFAIIGLSYNVVDQQNIGFMPLLLANILGVGLLEELIKVLPVFVILMGRKRLRWYECCALGLASGFGFGLVEAFDYAKMYNGLFDQLTYWIRFVSCVVSHGISTAAAVLFLHRFPSLLDGELTLGDAVLRLLILISIPMCLHGLYNTLSTKGMDGLALAVDLFNFGWFALLIETARDKEGDMFIEVPREDPKTQLDAPTTKPTVVVQPFYITPQGPNHLGM